MTKGCYVEGITALLESHGIRNFTALELCDVGRVNEGSRLMAPPAELWPNIIPTVEIAQEARDYFGEPLHVNSGYRNVTYNRSVGSTSRRHVGFYALDVFLDTRSTLELYEWLDHHPRSGEMGIGLYPTFVHMDTMGVRARWGSLAA